MAEASLTQEQVPLERVETKPLRDYSDFWELPLDSQNRPMVLAAHEGSSTFALSSATEGRAFSFPPFAFQFKGALLSDVEKLLPVKIPPDLKEGNLLRPVVFCDYSRKGVGMKTAQIPPHMRKSSAGDKVDVRYIRRSGIERTDPGPPGGGFFDDNNRQDETFSFLYHSWGGRTRLPIDTYPLETISTPDGILSIEEARQKGYIAERGQLVTVGWGVRSKWRIDDLAVIFKDREWRSTSRAARLIDVAVPKTPHVRYLEVHPCSEKTLQNATVFARELVRRASHDEDDRWISLAKKYPEISSSNLSDFYLDYLTILSATVGGQMGMLYSHHVYLSQFNFQNWSALGEVMDFDVALINATTYIDGTRVTEDHMRSLHMLRKEDPPGSKPDEAGLQADVVFYSMAHISRLFSMLRNEGIITYPGGRLQQQFDEAMDKFGQSFAREGLRGLSPVSIVRNALFLKKLEEIFDKTYWEDYPNPVINNLRNLSRIYQPYGHFLKRRLRGKKLKFAKIMRRYQ